MTVAVGLELLPAEPALFVAVTCERIVAPTSPDVSVYVSFVAPLMTMQLLPVVSHRCQW